MELKIKKKATWCDGLSICVRYGRLWCCLFSRLLYKSLRKSSNSLRVSLWIVRLSQVRAMIGSRFLSDKLLRNPSNWFKVFLYGVRFSQICAILPSRLYLVVLGFPSSSWSWSIDSRSSENCGNLRVGFLIETRRLLGQESLISVISLSIFCWNTEKVDKVDVFEAKVWDMAPVWKKPRKLYYIFCYLSILIVNFDV